MIRRHRPRLRIALPAVLAFLLAGLLSPIGAEAHAIIVSSKPAANSQVLAGPVDIVLQFNSLIDAKLSRLDAVDPAGKVTPLPVTGLGKGVLSAQLQAELVGKWGLRWQVLSIDGHITRGEIPFSVVAKTVP